MLKRRCEVDVRLEDQRLLRVRLERWVPESIYVHLVGDALYTIRTETL